VADSRPAAGSVIGDVTRRQVRWARWGLAGYVVLIAALVLLPTSPMQVVRLAAEALREGGAWFVRDGWVEFGANVAMFVPLGLLLTLSLSRRTGWGLILACIISVGIEAIQVVLPSRVTSVRDIVANVIGAVIGYGIALLFLRRRRA